MELLRLFYFQHRKMTAMKFVAVLAALRFLVEASHSTLDPKLFIFELQSTQSSYTCSAKFHKTEFDDFYSCLFLGVHECRVGCDCSRRSCTAANVVRNGNPTSHFGCKYYSCRYHYSNNEISCIQTVPGYRCSQPFRKNDSSSCTSGAIGFNWNYYYITNIYSVQSSYFVSCGSNCSCPSTTTKPTTPTTKSAIPMIKRTTTMSPITLKTRTTQRKISTWISTRPTTMKPSSKSSTSYTGVTESSTLSNKASSKLPTSSSLVVSTNDTSSTAASEPTSSAINSALIAGLTVPAIILSVIALVGGWCIWRRRKFPKKPLPSAQMLPNNAPSIHNNSESSNAKPEVHYSDQYFNILDNNVSQEETKHVYQNIANENRKTKNKCSHAFEKSSIESQPIASDSVYSKAHSLVESNYVNYPSRDNGRVASDAVTSTSVSKGVISLPGEDSHDPRSIYFTSEENSSERECVTKAGVGKNVRSSLAGEDRQDSGTVYFTPEENPSEFDQHNTESAGTSNPAFANDECDCAINEDITHTRTHISPDIPTKNTNRSPTSIQGVLRYQNIELNTNAELQACKQSTVTDNEYEPIGTELTYEFVNPGGFSRNPKVNVIHEANDSNIYSKANSIACLNDGAAKTKPPNAYAKLKDVDRNIENPYDMLPEEIDADQQVSAQSTLSMDNLNPYSLAETDPYTFSNTNESDDVTSVASSVDA